MVNYTKSVAGCKLLKQWFLHPLTNIDDIKQRQDTIAFFLLTRNLEAVTAFQDSLRNFKNVNVSVLKCIDLVMLATSGAERGARGWGGGLPNVAKDGPRNSSKFDEKKGGS